MSLSHKRVERSTGPNLLPIFTKLATKVESPRRCDNLLCLMQIRNTCVHQTGSEINFFIVHMENIFNVKYIEYGEKYNVGHNGGQRGNNLWTLDSHYELWPWMTFDSPSSRWIKLHVKYTENGHRYDDGINRSQLKSIYGPSISTQNRFRFLSHDFRITFLEYNEIVQCVFGRFTFYRSKK